MNVFVETRDRYRTYSKYLKEKYGGRVHKISINLPGTCPNRDGTRSTGGCIYCDEEGSGFNALPSTMSVREQVEKSREYLKKRFKAEKFISYFQSYTNTYLSLDKFKTNIRDALGPDIVGISVSTRPDCVQEEYLDALGEIKDEWGVDINVELGLQTVNYRTLKKINRGHTLAEFVDAVNRIKPRGFEICVHMILNLPWDDITDVVEGAKFLSALGVHYVKLHSLYIVEGTPLGEMFKKGEIEVAPLSEYVRRVGAFLEYLDPNIVIQRLAAKGPKGKLLFCNWGLSLWAVKQEIERYLEEQDIYQGKKFNYLKRNL
ncbi:MAG: hypothetical protein XD50_0383 [Clostridia bacterium 41_269]|nr:MAG: hypothetical protein XD50_0383 [Clostridia bacterium 41_269]